MSSDLKIGVFLNFFLVFFFFFSFLRSTLDEITKRYVKNYGVFFGKKREKKKKKHSSYGKKKKFEKKKGPDGIRTRDLRFPIIAGLNPRSYETDALPLGHRATTHVVGWN